MKDYDELPFSSEDEIPFSDQNSLEDIPFQSNTPPILIMDDRIKDIPAKNANISFKRTSIILPVVAFIFVSILGMYLFVVNSKADSNNLIRIEEKGKYGYIDSEGTLVTRAKYQFGSEYYKGFAIVKNVNNLYGVLNSKGVLEVPFGNYYYIGLFGNRYIASKITRDGLKQSLLDYKLNELTSFKYDSLSYSNNGMYLFTKGETMGILNKDGKEIYSFKVDEVDDKNIDIEISEVDEDLPLSERYAKVKINNSSTIINLSSGKEIYSYTLKDINVLRNNVFYIKADEPSENSTYIVINNNDVKLKTSKYKRVRVDDYNSNIAIGIGEDTKPVYINLLTQKVINENENNDYYYGNGLVLEKSHDFSSDKDIYNIISSSKIEGTFENYTPINNIFSNNLLSVAIDEDKYNYINTSGNLINNNSYDEVEDFNNNGYAIVANDKKYGIINVSGKEVISLSYTNLDFIDEELFDLLKDNYKKELFVYEDDNNNFGFINSKGKVEIKAIYDSVDFITEDYPIALVSYSNDYLLINLATGKELPIKVNSRNIKIKSNYIIIDDKYYNYSGKLIYSLR